MQCRRPRLIPGSGRSTGERIGYPPQYSWASLLTQLVKNLPAMPETWVQLLGWEGPMEKEKATHSQYSGLENSIDYIVHGVAKSWTWLNDFHFHFPSPGDLPDPGIKPGSPVLQADSLSSEPPEKPKNTGVGRLSLLQGNFLTVELNWGLLHCRWILY